MQPIEFRNQISFVSNPSSVDELLLYAKSMIVSIEDIFRFCGQLRFTRPQLLCNFQILHFRKYLLFLDFCNQKKTKKKPVAAKPIYCIEIFLVFFSTQLESWNFFLIVICQAPDLNTLWRNTTYLTISGTVNKLIKLCKNVAWEKFVNARCNEFFIIFLQI